MHRLVRLAAVAALVVIFPLGAPGCSKPDPGPEAVVEAFLAYLQHNPLSSESRTAYGLLASSTREELERRAAALSERTGVTVEPWQVLTYRRLARGDRVTGLEEVRVTDATAEVKVTFDWWVGSKDRLQPDPVTFELVREEGSWRVVLPLPGAGETEGKAR